MALSGLVQTLCLLGAEADLQCIVAVARSLLFLHDDAGTGLHHSDRDEIAFGIIKLRHAELFANKSCHKCIPALAITRGLLEYDLNIDSRGNVELSERIDRLLCRLENIQQTFMCAYLVLVPRLLVDVR